MTLHIDIDGRRIGLGEPCYVVAEVAQAHDGSLGIAHSFIDAAAAAGADAIKFQTHIADAESTKEEPFRIKFGYEDDTRYDYWRRMEFTAEQWQGLARHARQSGVCFLSSAFSIEAVRLLRGLRVPAWKVGSGEFASRTLMAEMAAAGGPIIYSTGMSRTNEVDEFSVWCRSKGVPFALFQCTSKYPTPLREVGLNVLGELRARHSCPVGLSDHSGMLYPGLAAMAQGADLLEVHVTFDREMFGPDASASLTFREVAEIVKARDAFYEMQKSPVDKDKMATALTDVRNLFSKSLAVVRDLEAGTVLTEDLLTQKKPGSGIPPSDLAEVVGRRLKRFVKADRLLRWDDLDG